jgi:hypothetical protein
VLRLDGQGLASVYGSTVPPPPARISQPWGFSLHLMLVYHTPVVRGGGIVRPQVRYLHIVTGLAKTSFIRRIDCRDARTS